LHIVVLPSAVWRRVLDAEIREVDVPIEVRQVVLASPFSDLFGAPIRPAVAVGAVTVPLLQESLIVALELVVQNHPLNPCAAVLEPFGFSQIRAKDLRVVLNLARLFQVGVERLAAVLFASAMRIEEVPATLRQHHDDVPASIELNG